MKASTERLIRQWRANVGKQARCLHTGRVGYIDFVYWRNRTETGGDWGLYLAMSDSNGEFVCRPAFVEILSE